VDPEPHLLDMWEAFFALSNDRQVGMGLGPIPWSSLDRYAQRFGIDDPDEFDVFAFLIRTMDGAFLRHADETSKKPEKP
jgi:hypothetical protein